MPDADDIRWFKTEFGPATQAALAGTPFDLDMLVAIACQETGHIWSRLRRKGLPTAEIARLCVGDTLDSDRGRSAFPPTKADLLAVPNGQAMFDIARKALLDMAAQVPGFEFAPGNPHKFCHGFGVFQRDLQFFKTDPDYFLQRKYEHFDSSLEQCLGELRRGLKKLGLQAKAKLSDQEFAAVAIAYNTGGFTLAKGLKQGHFNGKRFYGEEIFDFVRLSRTVAVAGATPAIAPPPPGVAILPPPSPPTTAGLPFVVDTMDTPLRLRSAPVISDPPSANVIAHMPDGHPVRALSGFAKNGFLEVETSLFGALLRGFASEKMLRAAPAAAATRIAAVAPPPPKDGITAVLMPRRPGTVTTRTAQANAHSLNEPGQPTRAGTTAVDLTDDIAMIIKWLDVESSAHARYQPRDGLTFCNIYAHDFCHLAGVYLPRVWWTQAAVRDLAQGRPVAPLIGATIEEMRANALFQWLRDFGDRFGWRQTGTLDKLQQAANQGAVGLIVARRKQEGPPGHIVIVIPETDALRALRNDAGEVTAPVQSQAGSKNFASGTGMPEWWRGAQFADAAFWVHA